MKECLAELKNLQSVVSVGVAYGDGLSVEYVNALSAYMQNNFYYYEIVIVVNPAEASQEVVDLLSLVQNVHVIVLNCNTDDDNKRFVLFENAIGDFVVLIDPRDASVECVGSLVSHAIISGGECVRLSCVSKNSTFYSFSSRVFFKFISFVSGYKIDSALLYTGCYTRILVNSINAGRNSVSSMRVLLASVGFTVTTMHGTSAPARSMAEFLKGICSCVDVIGSVPQRLLRLASLLALGISFVNIMYILYIFFVWSFFSNVQPGWTISSLVQSAHNFILFFIIFIITSVISAQICSNAKEKICVAKSISHSDLIRNFSETNVEKA